MSKPEIFYGLFDENGIVCVEFHDAWTGANYTQVKLFKKKRDAKKYSGEIHKVKIVEAKS